MSNAKDLIITKIEMEIMFLAHLEGIKSYNEQYGKLLESQKQKSPLIQIVDQYDTIEAFTKAAMKNLATASWGDIVLHDRGVEVARVKGNYTVKI